MPTTPPRRGGSTPPDPEPESTPTPTTEGEFNTADAPATPVVPAGTPPEDVKAILSAFIKDQQAWRAQVIQEVRRGRAQEYVPAAPGLSAEQRQAARLEELAAHPYYCAVCGRLHDMLKDCLGPLEQPHPPNLVTSTQELLDPPDPLDKEAWAQYTAGHTPAPTTDELLAAQR